MSAYIFTIPTPLLVLIKIFDPQDKWDSLFKKFDKNVIHDIHNDIHHLLIIVIS